MNVGPTAHNSRSIYGCTMAEPEFTAPNGCRLTQSEDGKRLYVHLLEYPYQTLQMPCLAGKIEYAQFLHDASEIKFHSNAALVRDSMANTFILPTVKPHTLIPVIEVFLK